MYNDNNSSIRLTVMGKSQGLPLSVNVSASFDRRKFLFEEEASGISSVSQHLQVTHEA